MNLTNEHDAYKIFGDGNAATIIESESPILTGRHGALRAEPRRAPCIPAGSPARAARRAGPTASASASSPSSRTPAGSWSRYNFSPEVEKAAATTVVDSTGALVLFPVARTSVVADPDVIKAQPLQPIYAEQNKFQTDRWSSPYDLAPVFNEVVAKMIDGSLDAEGVRRRRQGLTGHHHQVPEQLTVAVGGTEGRFHVLKPAFAMLAATRRCRGRVQQKRASAAIGIHSARTRLRSCR